MRYRRYRVQQSKDGAIDVVSYGWFARVWGSLLLHYFIVVGLFCLFGVPIVYGWRLANHFWVETIIFAFVVYPAFMIWFVRRVRRKTHG
jgi:hypothetical protein